MTTSRSQTPTRTRRLHPGFVALLGLVVGAVGIAVILLAVEGRGALDGLGVDTDTFQLRWNDTMDELGADHRLGDLSWEPDDPIGLEVAAETIDGWALLELYRDETDEMTAVLVVAQPGADTAGTSFRDLGTAAIAAALQEDRSTAAQLLAELGGDDAGAAGIDARLERDGVALNLERDGGTWQLRITAATAD